MRTQKFSNVEWRWDSVSLHRNQLLGQNWVKYFYQAIEISQLPESDGENESEDFWSEETDDVMSNHWLNIAIEYYLITTKAKNKVRTGYICKVRLKIQLLVFIWLAVSNFIQVTSSLNLSNTNHLFSPNINQILEISYF
jgi:hypothetical protein